jgi:hypothetical protein
MKLVEVFVAGVVVGLAVSWTYILSLKATIRVCMKYIEDRIHNCTDRVEGTGDRTREESETSMTEEPGRTDERTTTSPAEGQPWQSGRC